MFLALSCKHCTGDIPVQTRTEPENPLAPSEAAIRATCGGLPKGDQTRLHSSGKDTLQGQAEPDPEAGEALGQ